MTTPPDAPTPLVSVVIPVFNSVSYLAETLDSMLVQGLSETELEVVIVDDGSDDGSEKMVDDYAQRYPNFRVIHQAPSGGPASPCNVGAYAARGKFFFILGSDDVLTPNAMRDLAGIAEREGSDIVLGKLGSIGGRRTPGAVFAKTVYDADLVENRVFNTLSAVKLFRTELLHRTGALHPTSLRIGSDQPFVATLFLAAGKVSIGADRDYVLIRTRDDGTNITSTRRTPRDYMDLLILLIPVIVDGSEPGDFRDGLLRRPFRNTLTKSLKPGFLALDDATQLQILNDLQRTIRPLFNEATASHLEPLPRTKVELALDGDLDTLHAVMGWEKAGGSARVVHDGTRFSYDFPEDLAARIGESRIHSPVVKGDVMLTGVRCQGTVIELDIRAGVPECSTTASETLLRLRNRATSDEVDLPTETVRDVTGAFGHGREIHAHADLAEYPIGVWDAFIVQSFGNDELVTRFGARREKNVTGNDAYLFSGGDAPQAVGKLYYTRGPGNLSIDLGFTLTTNDLPDVTVRGVVQLDDNATLAVVSVVSTDLVEFRSSPAAGQRADLLPCSVLSGELYAVRMPKGLSRNGPARRLIISSLDRERSVPLPRPVHVAGGAPSGRPEHRDESGDVSSTGEILQRVFGDLGVVARRAGRRIERNAKALSQRVRGATRRERH